MVNDVHKADATTGVNEGFGGFETRDSGCWVEEEREVDEWNGVGRTGGI